jgi:hypothetical protein
VIGKRCVQRAGKKQPRIKRWARDKEKRIKQMDAWILPVLVIVTYVVLMRWVLPRFGVQT